MSILTDVVLELLGGGISEHVVREFANGLGSTLSRLAVTAR
jgi:hypothetical protein